MSYPVGTICIGQKFAVDGEFNGLECVITDPLRHYLVWVDLRGNIQSPDYLYTVVWENGRTTRALHRNLRLKRHDDEDKAASLREKDRSKVSTLISTCKAAAEKALAKLEKV